MFNFTNKNKNIRNQKRPPAKRRVATLNRWDEVKKNILLAIVPAAVAVFSFVQQPSQIKLFKDVAGEVNNRISVASNHAQVQVNKLTIKESAGGRLYAVHDVEAGVEVSVKIPIIKPAYKKLKGKKLKEWRADQFFNIMTERAYNGALKHGIPQAYMFAQNVIGTSRNVLLALGYKESGLGTNPAAHGNALQTIGTTRMEYFLNFGENFVEELMPHAPEQAKAVQRILPYIGSEYVSGKKIYLTKDVQYEKKYGKTKVKNGYSKTPVRDYLEKITKDPLTSVVLTMYHLKHQYQSQIVKPCKASNDKKTLQYFEGLGDTKYRLIHFLGANGALRAVKNRHRTQKGSAHYVISKSSQREILSIPNTASGKEAFKAMTVDFQEVVDRMTVLSALYRASPEGRNTMRKQIGLATLSPSAT